MGVEGEGLGESDGDGGCWAALVSSNCWMSAVVGAVASLIRMSVPAMANKTPIVMI